MNQESFDYIGICIEHGGGVADIDAQRIIRELHEDGKRLRGEVERMTAALTEAAERFNRVADVYMLEKPILAGVTRGFAIDARQALAKNKQP